MYFVRDVRRRGEIDMISLVFILILMLSNTVNSGAYTHVDSLAHRALNLWLTPFSAQFSFSQWVADEWENSIQARFASKGSAGVIYYAWDDLAEVRTIATFREPTNIGMDRKGSQRKLDAFYQQTLFGDDGTLFLHLFPDGKCHSAVLRLIV